MTRVAGPHGYLDIDVARRFLPDEAMTYLPDDTTELALVQVNDSETGQHTTIMGDARLFQKHLADMSIARERGNEDEIAAIVDRDLSVILPLQREGWPTEWIAELSGLARTNEQRQRTAAGFGGYL
jgi:hypothetical protein